MNGQSGTRDNQDASMQQQNSRSSGKGQGKKRQGIGNSGIRRNRDEPEGQVASDVRFRGNRRHEEHSSTGFPTNGQVRGQQAGNGSESMYVGANNWNLQGKEGEWSSNNGYVNYGDLTGAVWVVPAPQMGVDGTPVMPAGMPISNGESQIMQGTLVLPADMNMQGFHGGWDFQVPWDQANTNCWQVRSDARADSNGADSGGTPGTCTPTSATGVWSSHNTNTPGSSEQQEPQLPMYYDAGGFQVTHKNTFLNILPQSSTMRQVRSAGDLTGMVLGDAVDVGDY